MVFVIIILVLMLLFCSKLLGTLLRLIGNILSGLFKVCGCLTIFIIGTVAFLLILL